MGLFLFLSIIVKYMSNNSKSDSIYEDANSRFDPSFFDDNNSQSRIINNGLLNQNQISFSNNNRKENINNLINQSNNYYSPPISYHNNEIDKGCCKDKFDCYIY